jgi:amino acid transporter
MAAEPGLRRELGLRDTVLFAITCVIGTRWIGAAAHAGPGSLALWALAALFFLVPFALAIGTLAARDPSPGGFYHWIKRDFGERHAFVTFVLYWMSNALWFPNAAMAYMAISAYALGPRYEHLAENRVYIVLAALAAIWIALGTNLVGMRIGKWTENANGLATYGIAALLAGLALAAWLRRGSATAFDLLPAPAWGTVNFWSQIAFALTGLELASMMGGEVRDPERTLPRAGWIAAGAAALFYITGTAALLVLLPPPGISVLHGVAQGAAQAGRELGLAWAAPAIAVLSLFTALGQFGGIGSGNSRLPFAVGADHLLPRAFARVHPRWGTPHVSLLTQLGVCSFFLVAMQLGDTMVAAFQELVSMSVLCSFIPFFYMFLCSYKAGRRLSALSGMAVTGIAIGFALIPPEDARSPLLYEAKILGGTAALVILATVLYARGRAAR